MSNVPNPKRKRLNLDLSNADYEILQTISNESDKNMSEVLRTALAIYNIAQEEKKKGRELAIIENDEIKKIIASLVKNDSETISLEQFVSLMSEKISEKGAREEILKAFRLFDDDQTGKISLSNLKRVAEELGESLTEEELKEMIEEADHDKDGAVNQEDFLRIMKKTCLY